MESGIGIGGLSTGKDEYVNSAFYFWSGAIVNFDTGEEVSTINNIFDSVWEKVLTSLNGVDISDHSAGRYNYKAYLENHLSYSNSNKDFILPSKGYIKDTAKKINDVGVLASTNPLVAGKASGNTGFKKSKKLFAESKWVYFCNNVHIDICTLHKYIPSGVKI